MYIPVNRLNSINLDFCNRDNSRKNFANNQNEKFDILEDFDLISLENKEINKQKLQEAAQLISLIQSDESGDFAKACGIYLTKMPKKKQSHNNKGVLELIKVVQGFVSVTATNTLRNFRNRFSNLFSEDNVALIGSAISDIGRFCCDLCETISTIGNKGLKYSAVSC